MDESGLDTKRPGFSELNTAEDDLEIMLTLNQTELTKVSLKKEAELYLDGDSFIERLRVHEPAFIDGDGAIETLVISSSDIISYILPDDEERTSQRYDDVDYRSH